MVRKQLYITEEQEALLKRLAEERGVTEAEVVRTALDALTPLIYEQPETRTGRIREAAVMERYVTEEVQDSTGLALDQRLADATWQKELAFLKSLDEKQAGEMQAEAWKFNREEMYEERLAKILPRH